MADKGRRVFIKIGKKYAHMSEEPSGLEIFSILNDEKISKIIDLLDENIVEDQFRSPKLHDLKKLGFTDQQAHNILESFFNFYISVEYHDDIIDIIDHSNLQPNAKSLAKKAFEEIVKRADKTKIEVLEKSADLEQFGHPHLHNLEVVSEFRPIMKNGKLERLSMAIILDGITYNKDHETKSLINFQMSLESFTKLVKTLNKDLEDIKLQITTLKKQLGDNIVK